MRIDITTKLMHTNTIKNWRLLPLQASPSKSKNKLDTGSMLCRPQNYDKIAKELNGRLLPMQVSPHLKQWKNKLNLRMPPLCNSELMKKLLPLQVSKISPEYIRGRSSNLPRRMLPPSLINYVDNDGILIYLWNASDFQRPKALICESDIPASAA